MAELEVIPWFGGSPIVLDSIDGTNKVAYSWTSLPGVDDEPKTINHLLVWHDCDKNRWRDDSTKTQSLIDSYMGWRPAGVGLHDLITAEPLHIEASVYWPSCCGMHGWIRDGAWVSA